MDNNQFQKNVYQVPASPGGESFVGPVTSVSAELSQTEVDQRFKTIAREEVLLAFNQMTQDLEMSLSGFEERSLPAVELARPNPVAIELLQIGTDLIERRSLHHESLVKSALAKRIIGWRNV